MTSLSFAGIGGAFVVKKRTDYDFIDDDSQSQSTSHSVVDEDDEDSVSGEPHIEKNDAVKLAELMSLPKTMHHDIREDESPILSTSTHSPSLSTTSSLSLPQTPAPSQTALTEESLSLSTLSKKGSVRFSMDYEEEENANKNNLSLAVHALKGSLSDSEETSQPIRNLNSSTDRQDKPISSSKFPVTGPHKSALSKPVSSSKTTTISLLDTSSSIQRPPSPSEEKLNTFVPLKTVTKLQPQSSANPPPAPLVRKKSNFAPILGGGFSSPSIDSSFGGAYYPTSRSAAYVAVSQPNLPAVQSDYGGHLPSVSTSIPSPQSSSISWKSPSIMLDLDQGSRAVISIPNIHSDGWDGGLAGLAISRFREFVVTAGRYDAKICLWNTGTGQLFDTFEVQNEVILATNSSEQISEAFGHERTNYWDGNRENGSSVDYVGVSKSYDEIDRPAIFMRDRRAPPTQIGCLALAPNDSFILVGCNNSLMYGWNLSTRQRLLIDGRKGFASRDRRSIEVISIANNMEYFVHGDEQGVISTWRMTNQCKLKIDPDDKDNYLVLGMRFNNYSLTPDFTSGISISIVQSCIYAIVNHRVAAWDYSTGKDFFMEENYLEKADDCMLSGDCQVFVTRYFEDGTSIIRLFNTSNWEKIITIQCHGSKVCSLSVTWDGALLVTGHDDGRVILWDAMIGEQLLQHNLQENKVYNPIKVLSNIFVAISPDGAMIVAGHCKTGMLKIWNTTFEEQYREIHFGDDSWNMNERCICRLNDEIMVASEECRTSSAGGSISNMALFRVDRNLPNSSIPYRIQGLHQFQVHDLKAWSSDGRVFVVTDSNQNLMIWHTTTNELSLLEEDFHPLNVADAMICRVALSGNAKYVFVYLIYDHGDPSHGTGGFMMSKDDDEHSVLSNISDVSIGEKKLFARVYKWEIVDPCVGPSRGMKGQDFHKMYDKIIPHFDTQPGNADPVGTISPSSILPFQVSNDGAKLVFWSSEYYGSFIVMDTSIGEVCHVIRTGWTLAQSVAVKLAQDGKHVLFGNGPSSTLTVYSIATGSVVHEVKHKQYKGVTHLRSSEIADDNSIFITVSDLMFTIWDMKTGSHLQDVAIPIEVSYISQKSNLDNGGVFGNHIQRSSSTPSSPRVAMMLQEMSVLGIDIEGDPANHSEYGNWGNEEDCKESDSPRYGKTIPVYIEKVAISSDGSYFVMTLTNQQRFRYENLYRNYGCRQVNPKVTSLTSLYKVFQYELDLVNTLPSYPWTIMKRMLSNPIEEKLIHWFLLQSRVVGQIVTGHSDGKVNYNATSGEKYLGAADTKKCIYCDHIMHYAIMKPSAYGFIKILITMYPQIIFLKRYGIHSPREYQRYDERLERVDRYKNNHTVKMEKDQLFTILVPALFSKHTRTINLVLDAILSTLELSAELNNRDHGGDEGSIVHYGKKQDLIVHRHSHLSEKISIVEISNVSLTSPDIFVLFVKRLQLFVNEGTTKSSRHPIGTRQSSSFFSYSINDDSTISNMGLVIGGSKRRTPANYWYNFFQLRKENGTKLPWYSFQRLFYAIKYFIDCYFPQKDVPVTPFVLPIKDMTGRNKLPFLTILRNAVLEVDDYTVLTNEVVTCIVIYKWQRLVQRRLYVESFIMSVFAFMMFINAFYFENFIPFRSSNLSLSSESSSSNSMIYELLGIASVVFSLALCIRKFVIDVDRCIYYSRQCLLAYHLANFWTINHFIVNIFMLVLIGLQIVIVLLFDLPLPNNRYGGLMETLHSDMRRIAAVSMPLLALELLSIIQGFPDVGYCIRMLHRVLMNMRILVLLLVLSMMTFAGSFSLLLKSSASANVWGYSSSYWQTLLVVFNMVFGVYSIDDLLITSKEGPDNSYNLSPGVAAFLLASFLFFVVVVLLSFLVSSMTNYLKGLAPHVQAINTLELISLILEYEDQLPERKMEKEDPWIQVLKRNDSMRTVYTRSINFTRDDDSYEKMDKKHL